MKSDDKMHVELIDAMGTDLTVVNSARVSFDNQSSWENNDSSVKCLSERDKKLISYLAKHKHWTPFSHVQITLRETVPIFVARQRFKHMIGFTYNEISRRYVTEQPSFYSPDFWREKPEGSIKQGSGTGPIQEEMIIEKMYDNLMEKCLYTYKQFLDAGVAPEQARMVLPQSMFTSYYVTGSLAAWARAYTLRIESTAQNEIQQLASMWSETIAPICPVSWDALTKQN